MLENSIVEMLKISDIYIFMILVGLYGHMLTMGKLILDTLWTVDYEHLQ